ncbi:cocosin 1-like [Wolffia australiana]
MGSSRDLSLLSLAICALLLCCCHASREGESRRYHHREWRLEKLEAVEPTRKVQAEAGVIEYWDQSEEQLQVAGVAPYRTTIQPKGLLLPYYANSPRLAYVIQGKGIYSAVVPGCPETFQFSEQSQRRREQRGAGESDEHQRVHRFREGDVIALPAGVASWFYNDGQNPVVTITVADIANRANQLDQTLRRFELAGQQQQKGEEGSSGNVFRGLNVETVAEALGISRETARKLQAEGDRRGNIVRVEKGLRLARPEQAREEEEAEGGERERKEEEEEEREERERKRREGNGVDEVFCNFRNRENIRDPARADVFSREAGSVTTVNSGKLPILRYLRLSAEGGFLRPNAHFAPHWNINANSLLYVVRGRARVQISGGGEGRRALFDGEVRRGQILVVPQNFVVAAQASGEEAFEWVSFKTEDKALVSPVAGKASVFRGLPESVLASAYRLSSEEARTVKHGRGSEFLIFRPRHQQQEEGRSAAY